MKISFSLNKKSIAEAKKQLEQYKNNVRSATEAAVTVLTEVGREEAQKGFNSVPAESLADEQYDTVEVVAASDGRFGAYGTTSPRAKYYEFGTGVVGSSNPHPSHEFLAAMGWQYASGPFQKMLPDGRIGWVWKDPEGNTHVSHGIISSHPLYDSVLFLRTHAHEYVKRTFEAYMRL